MSWLFVTWSERKAYKLLSLARNEGLNVLRSEIPKYLSFKDGSHCPYKSFVEIDCDETIYDRLIAEMYETVEE
jgi:hypothetical protein